MTPTSFSLARVLVGLVETRRARGENLGRKRHPAAPLRRGDRRGDRSEQTVRLVVRAGRKEQRIRRAGGGAVAEADAP